MFRCADSLHFTVKLEVSACSSDVMTMAPAFDTLKFTDRLIASGVSQDQARAQVEALQEALQSADVTTKHDLREFQHHMDLKFAEMDAKFTEVDARFAEVDARFAEVDVKFSKMDAKIDAKVDHLKVSIESVKTDILKWVTSLLLAQAAVIAALVKLLS